MDYILDVSVPPYLLGNVLPVFFEAGREPGFWRDFMASGGLDWLEQFENVDAETTIFAIRILASIAASSKGRGRVQQCVRLLASFLCIDGKHGFNVDRSNLDSLKKSEGFAREARDLAKLLQQMKLDRIINKGERGSWRTGITPSIHDWASHSGSVRGRVSSPMPIDRTHSPLRYAHTGESYDGAYSQPIVVEEISRSRRSPILHVSR
jgi:hypothetical protein